MNYPMSMCMGQRVRDTTTKARYFSPIRVELAVAFDRVQRGEIRTSDKPQGRPRHAVIHPRLVELDEPGVSRLTNS